MLSAISGKYRGEGGIKQDGKKGGAEGEVPGLVVTIVFLFNSN